jgi:glycosyltransferase involved in cell wall biosynthesis
LAKFSGVPNVLSLHGGDLYDPSKRISPHRHAFLRAWIRRLLKKADRIVAQSHNTLQNAREFYVPDLRASLIPLGIRRPATECAARQSFGFSEKDVLFITVGRLVARKATDQLISLLQDLNSEHAHLLIIGSGPLEGAIREKAKELQIGKKVHFLGHINEVDKFKLLHMSDLFVSTSQHEGFGLVFLEAMACGLPVVCYDHGGQTDFLEDGRTGYVVALNDRAALTARCRIIASDKQSRIRMGMENRCRVEELFIDRCAARYEDLFREVIEDYKDGYARGYSHRP